MRIVLGCSLLAVAACGTTSADDHKVPGASLTPKPDTGTVSQPCGDSIAWNGDASPDAIYTYAYNAAGELTGATGVFTAGGPDDVIAYGYDAAGDFTSMTESDGSGGWTSDITAAYDPTDGLTDYDTSWAGGGSSDGWDYAMSAFVAPWQPGREVLTETGGQPFGYTLAYDSSGRLTLATPDSGAPTTYTYDDAAGTLALDTGSGAFTGLISYDDNGNELSEVWGGTDPSVIDSSTVYVWNDGALVSATYSSGTQAAPTTLAVEEVDTMLYNCPAAKRGGNTRVIRAGHTLH
jgi:YD repeat-containing protein